MKAVDLCSATLWLGSILLTTMAVSNNVRGQSITPKILVERYYNANGMDHLEDSVDQFIVGNPTQVVTGVCVTSTATVEVIRRAAANGLNFIVTHEPTFYSGRDKTSQLTTDPVFKAKQELLIKHGIAIWRNHDHIHRREPDGIVDGIAERLGWKHNHLAAISGNQNIYRIQDSTVGELASYLAKTLKANQVRIVGDPDLSSRKVGLVVGAPGPAKQIEMLQRDDVEILVAGETREWETVEYVRDASALGMRKALILLGHVPSEEEGMRGFAKELGTLAEDIPVKFIPAGDPFLKSN